MSDVHTDTETVERLAAALENGGVWSTGMQVAAATLRALLAERDRLAAEVASLRLTLGGKTFSADVPEPIGCPLPGACATVAEIVRGREVRTAWLRVIQAENTCGVTGKPCDAVRCGCAAEQEMLIREATEARDALAGGREDD